MGQKKEKKVTDAKEPINAWLEGKLHGILVGIALTIVIEFIFAIILVLIKVS